MTCFSVVSSCGRECYFTYLPLLLFFVHFLAVCVMASELKVTELAPAECIALCRFCFSRDSGREAFTVAWSAGPRCRLPTKIRDKVLGGAVQYVQPNCRWARASQALGASGLSTLVGITEPLSSVLVATFSGLDGAVDGLGVAEVGVIGQRARVLLALGGATRGCIASTLCSCTPSVSAVVRFVDAMR
jgi:hypothetical protein